MINLKMTALATTLALMSLSATALDLKGLKIGDTFDAAKVKAAFEDPNSFCPNMGRHATTGGCVGMTVLGPTKMKYSVDAYNGKISTISLWFRPDYFDSLAPLFTAKFGAPTSDVALQMQNGYGAQYPDRMVTWEDGAVSLTLDKYLEADKGSISLREKPPVRNGSL
jgi:hypothetical protein